MNPVNTHTHVEVLTNKVYRLEKYTILPFDFSVESGEYTPTLKYRRNFIDDKYRKAIDIMYASDKVYFKYPTEANV